MKALCVKHLGIHITLSFMWKYHHKIKKWSQFEVLLSTLQHDNSTIENRIRHLFKSQIHQGTVL